ncbi:MAG: radical SAM protein [Ruminococcaceae bacterium]|nr:radical SAM protein [Oscillospiraceae bacterium]
MRHINIPVFIPHLGCPNQCIFCNQKYISGTVEFDEAQVVRAIEDVLSTASGKDECEIAFFGGSFTGIDRALMIRLLDIAQDYVKKGKAVGIRMSTRPDYISQEIIDILKGYTITCVELGIQSMNDSVLDYLKRGHTVADTVNATRLLKNNGIPFVGQMMVGLPGATTEDEVYCAEQICKLGATAARIYPTIVFKQTELECLTVRGEYTALSVDEAVERSAKALRVFTKHNVNCIRIGLSDSENLHSKDTYVAGPNSPSIGEMVKSRLIFEDICTTLTTTVDFGTSFENKVMHITCPKGFVSQVVGHKRKNIIEWKKMFGLKNILVYENPDLDNKTIISEIKEENSCV